MAKRTTAVQRPRPGPRPKRSASTKAAGTKNAAKRKPASKKPAPRKTTAKKKTASKKPAPRKTAAKKKTASKKPAPRKTAAKKAPTKKKAPASAHRSGVAEHGTRRRRTAHRVTTEPKKTVSKQSATKKTRSSIPSRRPDVAVAPATAAKWWLLASIVVVTAFTLAVLEAPFFEARNVQVSGISRTSEGAVLDALDLQPDTALLRYDSAAASESVIALPWVKQVEIIRQWPSTVRVVVRERTVESTVGAPDGSRWLVIGDDQFVVEERLTPPADVPIIIATHDVINASSVGERLVGVERALEVAHSLPLQLDPWVTTWESDADGRVTAHLVGSATAEFGAFADHRTQYVSLASILDGGASLVCLRSIDLAVADSPVLHRDPGCMVEAAALS